MEGGRREGGRKEVGRERVRRRVPRHEGGCVRRVCAHKPVEI